ncbi:MAG: Chagasin family peptidase inhibitor [Caulobacteraceae bacterium]|nr:Chagasin family peptidase inhibitor [Caulobacteraceae bacterium]
MQEASLDGGVDVQVGEPFKVQVRAEGATGRLWEFKTPDTITAVETVTEPQSGFGGRPTRWHVFRCEAAGEYLIKLRLHRPWESSGEDHVVRVVCRP